MSQRLRMARGLIGKVFESAFNEGRARFAADATPRPADAPLSPEAMAERKILPPYLGEMGLEVRFFLAAVEPWLHNGWRIPARRPALYPAGTAFAAPALFADVDAVVREAEAKPVACSMVFAGGTGGLHSFVTPRVASGTLRVQVENADAADLELLLRAVRLESKVKRLLVGHGILRERPLTVWDRMLTSMMDSDPVSAMVGVEPLAPRRQPAAFLNPGHAGWPHVGVQMRALGDARDSDAAAVLAAATEAAAHLGLPLLVYGHPGGTVQPPGLASTASLAPGDLLSFELALLRQCRLMFAPFSGWFDLMCWLRVPTLLERNPDLSLSAVRGMQVFRPRLALHDPARALAPQVDRLLAAETCLPDAADLPVGRSYFDWDSAWVADAMQTFVNDGNWRPEI